MGITIDHPIDGKIILADESGTYQDGVAWLGDSTGKAYVIVGKPPLPVVDAVAVPNSDTEVWDPGTHGFYHDLQFTFVNIDQQVKVSLGIDYNNGGSIDRYIVKNYLLLIGETYLVPGIHRIGGEDTIHAFADTASMAELHIRIVDKGVEEV